MKEIYTAGVWLILNLKESYATNRTGEKDNRWVVRAGAIESVCAHQKSGAWIRTNSGHFRVVEESLEEVMAKVCPYMPPPAEGEMD